MMDEQRSKFWTDMSNWTSDILRLEIKGGEPFYMKQFKNFANMLMDEGSSQRIAMTLSTNGTVADKVQLDRMANNFKDLAFSVSIDGIEDRFTYLRHPGVWDEVRDNLDYYYELHTGDYAVNVQISHTITALNVMYLPEFHEYFKNRWPAFKIWNNFAHYPKWITCAVLPAKAKNEITTILQDYDFGVYKSEIDRFKQYMNTPLYQNVVLYQSIKSS